MEYLYKQDYELSAVRENVEMIIYCAVSFFVPFLIGHPQFLVGTIVNATLIMAAFNLKSIKMLPVIIMPSLGVLSRGIIFTELTFFLVFMIPFIWVSNAIIVYAFKKLALDKKMNNWLSLGIGAGAKTLFLFGSAFVLVKAGVLPTPFLVTMGLFQLYTAVMGGALAIGTQGIKKLVQ